VDDPVKDIAVSPMFLASWRIVSPLICSIGSATKASVRFLIWPKVLAKAARRIAGAEEQHVENLSTHVQDPKVSST